MGVINVESSDEGSSPPKVMLKSNKFCLTDTVPGAYEFSTDGEKVSMESWVKG